jgi:hypothetical protein
VSDIVVIRRWKTRPGGLPPHDEPFGSLIALFPLMSEGDGLVNSYEHIGQHGAANYNHVIVDTTPARDYEDAGNDASYSVVALMDELRSIGYDPVQRERRPKR